MQNKEDLTVEDNVEVEYVYVDEEGNEIEDDSDVDVLIDQDGKVIENEYDEVEEKSRNRAFEDLARNDNERDIFKIKTEIDNLINNGKELKKEFFKEAQLVETEEAERLMAEAFAQIENIQTQKKGILGFSEKWLPNPINNFVQSSAIKIKEEERKRQDIVEITGSLFGSLKTKQDDVESSTIKFTDIKGHMKNTVSELEKKARYLEEKKNEEDISEMEMQNVERLITIISSNILMFKENIQNINAAQNISHQCVLHIDQMLPTIENSMTDSLAISAFLGKINNFKEGFTTVANVTNKIQQSNSDRIHSMIKNTGDFEELLTESVRGIEQRSKERQQLSIEMKKQDVRNEQKHIELRNTIADSLEQMSDEDQSTVFKSEDDVGEYYVPSKIDVGNRLSNKSNKEEPNSTSKVIRKKKVVRKKVVKSNEGEA
jgi:hypothetical protein